MKLRYLLTSILACLALAIGCTPDELPGLSGVEVTPSYFTFGVDGGSKEITVATTGDWTVTDVPAWLTVSQASGKGNGKFTVSAVASTDIEARTAYLKVNVGKETQLVTVNQDAYVPDYPEFKGGDYWIVFDGGAAIPLASAYGYLYTAPVNKDENGNITSTAQNIFTFTAVEGGFTIQDPSGQYYYMKGTYDSFNVDKNLPETGGVWSVKQTGATAYEIANVSNGKIMQYDKSYSSAGAYSSARGELANLVKVEVIPEPEPLGDATSIKDATEYEPELIVEGIVTASSTKGVIVTDNTGSLLVYGINSEVKIGDALKVQGNLSSYNKGYQLANPYQYEIASTGNEVTYPEATVLTEESISTMVKPALFLAQYASVKGLVSVDNYNNALIKVGDYTVKTYYSHDSYASYADKGAEIHGYVVAYKESAKEVSILVTSIEEAEVETPVNYSIDGKQWLAEVEGMQVLFDLGVYEEGALVVALPTMDGSAFGLYMTGSYEVVPADATSGKIVFIQYDYEWDEFMAPVEIAYSALSENSVNISAESVFGVADAVPCTAVAEPFDIITEGTGGDQPSGEIENGEYWFIEPTTQKVMTALGETQTYGRPASADAVNGASTAKNAYTFTYNPDWSCYTIQDSYGRYLYSSMQADGVTPYRTLSVSETVPSAEDENLAYYMWTVYNNGDGTYDVYNAATYYSITYSASYNNWEIYDPWEDDFSNLFPALVKADNPVEEEPETPAGTTLTLTNAEICAVMTSSETSYQTYTIESASGVWSVNASRNKGNTFLQCRGKKGAYIKTPEFDKDIKSVTLHFTDKKSVYANNVYCAFPSTWTAPTADAAYPEDGNVGRAVTDGSYSITIPVEEGNKQVYVSIIGTYAYYVDHIDVAF